MSCSDPNDKQMKEARYRHTGQAMERSKNRSAWVALLFIGTRYRFMLLNTQCCTGCSQNIAKAAHGGCSLQRLLHSLPMRRFCHPVPPCPLSYSSSTWATNMVSRKKPGSFVKCEC
eukprot:478001-Pelagomonas_calceolata.AAC.2